jgi:hypothetical protein
MGEVNTSGWSHVIKGTRITVYNGNVPVLSTAKGALGTARKKYIEALQNKPNKLSGNQYTAKTPKEQQQLKDIQRLWDLKTTAPILKWVGTQASRIGVSGATIMESVIRHSNELDRNKISKAFADLRNRSALYTLAPTGNRNADTRVREFLRDKALDELVRKFTPSLRQAHSGSLFEQAAVAVAAKAAGKRVLSFPKTGTSSTNNFRPNSRLNKYYEGNRITQVWNNPKYRADLNNGIFVLKSAFGLGRIKTNEPNITLQKLFYNLVTENSITTGQKNYTTKTNGTKRPLTNLVGKSANVSLWKGFYEVQPDVLYFQVKNGTLYVEIYEFKIGTGHAQREPAEYFQLVKAKRTLELIFQKNPPPYPYKIHIHFFPLKYRLVAGETPTNFQHPTASSVNQKWKNHYSAIISPQFSTHGSYEISKEGTTPEDFKATTGVDVDAIKVLLTGYAKAEQNAIARSLRHSRRTGTGIYATSEAASAAKAALSVRKGNNAISRALKEEVAAEGARPGPYYIGSLMRTNKTNIGRELKAALQYLEIAGWKLKTSSGNKVPIGKTLGIKDRLPTASYGSTWSGAKRANQNTINVLLNRINAAKSLPQNKLEINSSAILNRLKQYTLEPPSPEFLSPKAQNARSNMMSNAENVAASNTKNFETSYKKFINDHVNPSYGITNNNAKSAVENTLNRLARIERGRGQENVAQFYTNRKGLIPNYKKR